MNNPVTSNREYATGLARAAGGALFFGVPLLMTMEMWDLGAEIDPRRLALFTVTGFVLLVGLSYFAGFEETFSLPEDVMDALAAYAVGIGAAALLLWLLGAWQESRPPAEVAAMLALQAIPAAIGALLARKQFGAETDDEAEARRKERAGYPGELFLMVAGALFLAFNIAPTDEVRDLALKLDAFHRIALIVLSLGTMHAFVYGAGFAGEERDAETHGPVGTFLRFTLVGYILVLATCAYMLWTFGRFDDASVADALTMMLVLGFPAAMGAGAARLIV
jgi:putative integral membrane protein (TIGR02587 family)